MLQCSEFCLKHATETASFDSVIWSNCNIRIDRKPIYYHNYVNTGVTLVSDLMFSRTNIDSFNIVKREGAYAGCLLEQTCFLSRTYSPPSIAFVGMFKSRIK